MGMPTKKTRKIVVDDVEYRWAHCEKWGSSPAHPDRELTISVAIEAVSSAGSLLLDRACFPRTILLANAWEAGVVLMPRHVSELIRRALGGGWDPTAGSKKQRVDLLREIVINDPDCGSF